MNRPASRSLEHAPVFSWQRTHDGLIYTSGHAAVDPDDLRRLRGTFVEEARHTLDALRRTLHSANSGLDKVLKITVYMVDMKHYADFNRVYASFFPGEDPPARTCIEVQRLPYDFQLEIEAVAHT